MKRQKAPTDSNGDPGRDRPRGPRITETRLIGSLAALAAVGVFVLTGIWLVSLVREPSAPPASRDPQQSPPIAGERPGEGSRPREREPVVETSEVFASRDPFGPLRPGEGSSGGSTGETGASQPSWARVVELVDARRGGAEVKIEEATFTISEGRRFARYFRLLYTSSDCAAILFGDDQFTICEGERILK